MRDRIAIHRPLRQSARAAIVVACIGSLLAGCIVRVRQIAVENLPRNAAFSISTPVKAHLLDGSVVVFRGGARGNGNQLVGLGERYDIGLKPIGTVNSMSFDSVAGLESFRTGTDLFSSVLLTVPATALGSLAAAGLAIAIFGSCPTYYTADQTGEMALEAEGFSYSVVPIFEGRDVDALHGLPAAADSYELEVRNEALETHYINHMELIAVEHGADERVVPDPGGRPLVVRSGVTPAAAMTEMAATFVRCSHIRMESCLQAPPGESHGRALPSWKTGLISTSVSPRRTPRRSFSGYATACCRQCSCMT
jgi:hypothetical protein